MATPNQCLDCGAEIGKGSTRCVTCRGVYLSRESLRKTAVPDREILAMLAEGLNGTRVAVRLDISRPRAGVRIALARNREARRQQLGM